MSFVLEGSYSKINVIFQKLVFKLLGGMSGAPLILWLVLLSRTWPCWALQNVLLLLLETGTPPTSVSFGVTWARSQECLPSLLYHTQRRGS